MFRSMHVCLFHSLQECQLDLVGKNIMELCHDNDRGCVLRHYEQGL